MKTLSVTCRADLSTEKWNRMILVLLSMRFVLDAHCLPAASVNAVQFETTVLPFVYFLCLQGIYVKVTIDIHVSEYSCFTRYFGYI